MTDHESLVNMMGNVELILKRNCSNEKHTLLKLQNALYASKCPQIIISPIKLARRGNFTVIFTNHPAIVDEQGQKITKGTVIIKLPYVAGTIKLKKTKATDTQREQRQDYSIKRRNEI